MQYPIDKYVKFSNSSAVVKDTQSVSPYHYRGMTLLELIVVVSIIAILATFAVPSFKTLMLNNRIQVELIRWQQAFSFARQSAISNSSIITLCPTDDGLNCGKHWHQGAMIFQDIDSNKRLSSGERLLYRMAASPDKVTLTWRAFQNRNYLQFQHNGFTWYQNGTLRLCASGESANYNRALIVTRSGRVRLSKDANGDGIHEDAAGDDISCQ